MHFLHQSGIKCHGRLRSSKCVIDGRWVLQITDWGLASLRTHSYETEEARNRALLWTAPEVLRSHDDSMVTPKADVYSFGIILYETMFRNSPYDTEGDMAMSPEDVVARVRYGERPPYRPRIPEPNQLKPEVVDLMLDCWREKPNDRPDFSLIKKQYKDMNKGIKYNIVDNMLRMMEKYSNDLEEIIDSRTKLLTEEIKKTDSLLYRMLPPTAADCMKRGQQYQPELFKHATIYFSDIVSFTKLAGAATPLQVVDFLNELWTAFDDIILKYDVYKVETIGDAYLVASGLPVPNVERHAAEIALMALDVLSTVMAFTVRHEPGRKLEIRIGLHSGPVVTGRA
ncbi:hypothetical protein NP493_636g03014 [Ridgeia piscesae]|uniref:guanylate cyclase n=1 Tax=Ridgeia piscesae TaxID=27915 RepID=A0AAD9NRJ1_RIDPI|nr:hypothetical protein NP493_636g03014 [Ridgeia piscesae]